MKRRSFFINNQSGFILPYALFLTALILIVLSASIQIYNQDVKITSKHIDRIKIETLIQKGRAKFIEDITHFDSDIDEIEYVFPDGTVVISFIPFDTHYHLYFTVKTNRDSIYTTTNRLEVEI